MKTHAQAVVVGGGLVGCSVLYHLAKLGWKDVVLLERDELTSGSTWHAAAGIHGLHDNNNISKLQYYTMQLYAELEQETGQACGIFRPGFSTWRNQRTVSTSFASRLPRQSTSGSSSMRSRSRKHERCIPSSTLAVYAASCTSPMAVTSTLRA